MFVSGASFHTKNHTIAIFNIVRLFTHLFCGNLSP